MIDTVRLVKKVAGHGKGEIDSCHGRPKNEVRKHINREAGQEPRHMVDLVGGFDSGTQIVQFLSTIDAFNRPLTSRPDPKGFPLTRRSIKFYEPTVLGDYTIKLKALSNIIF